MTIKKHNENCLRQILWLKHISIYIINNIAEPNNMYYSILSWSRKFPSLIKSSPILFSKAHEYLTKPHIRVGTPLNISLMKPLFYSPISRYLLNFNIELSKWLLLYAKPFNTNTTGSSVRQRDIRANIEI